MKTKMLITATLFLICSSGQAESPIKVTPSIKKSICRQTAHLIPVIPGTVVTASDCERYAEVAMLFESKNWIKFSLMISVGDGYISDCTIKYSKSLRKLSGKPICDTYVP